MIRGIKVEILKVLFCLLYETGTVVVGGSVLASSTLFLCVSSCFVRSKKSKKFKGCVDHPHFN